MTPAAAIKRLPRRKIVHTFLGPFGADWSRAEVVAELEKAEPERIVEWGGLFRSTHGIAILRYSERGNPLLIETKPAPQPDEPGDAR